MFLFINLLFFNKLLCCFTYMWRLTISYQNFLFITLFNSVIFLLIYWCKAHYSYFLLRSRYWSFYYANFIRCISFIFSFNCRYNIFFFIFRRAFLFLIFLLFKNHISEHIFKTTFLQMFLTHLFCLQLIRC